MVFVTDGMIAMISRVESPADRRMMKNFLFLGVLILSSVTGCCPKATEPKVPIVTISGPPVIRLSELNETSFKIIIDNPTDNTLILCTHGWHFDLDLQQDGVSLPHQSVPDYVQDEGNEFVAIEPGCQKVLRGSHLYFVRIPKTSGEATLKLTVIPHLSMKEFRLLNEESFKKTQFALIVVKNLTASMNLQIVK